MEGYRCGTHIAARIATSGVSASRDLSPRSAVSLLRAGAAFAFRISAPRVFITFGTAISLTFALERLSWLRYISAAERRAAKWRWQVVGLMDRFDYIDARDCAVTRWVVLSAHRLRARARHSARWRVCNRGK